MGLKVDDYRKLENQPLVFVVADFRFSQVMKIGEYIPAIQESLRKDFPVVVKKTEQQYSIGGEGVAVSSLDRWQFLSADKRDAVEISSEHLVYWTSNYNRFDGFAETCKRLLSEFAKIVEPSLLTRVGLRYGDLVTVDQDENLEDLVNASFIKVSGTEGFGRLVQHRHEAVVQTECGTLVIRTLYGRHPLMVMPDAQNLPVKVKSVPAQGDRLIIDFDHFWEEGEDSCFFTSEVALSRLEQLHESNRKAFWDVTTEFARSNKWA